ncbi:MAG: recombination protein O N-terminal domain-containing protein [Treponema sp.]|jgi:DNA repair protein RecO (recombination protein O)|nr:recombination protein O N-terminal domain-containing protein [Treponema sp.]
MPRSFSYSALALRVKSSGESNREAWFLTAEEGLLRATVFGGPKSRLRSQVASFHEGKLLIYHDPVRDSRKVSDFDVQSWRPGIREMWERTMAADAVAETILASHGGGGNWPVAAKLAGTVLDAFDEATAAACSAIAIYFFWQWAKILGVKPELYCGACGTKPEVLLYSARKEALYCDKCATANSMAGSSNSNTGQSASIRLDPVGRLWLEKAETLPPEGFSSGYWSDELSWDAASLSQAKVLSLAVLAAALGKRLPTWEEI